MSGTNWRRSFLLGAAGAAALPLRAQGPPILGGIYNVVDFGTPRNGRDPDTKAVQAAIDACGGSGGGTVYFPPGRYYSGGLILRSGVHLYLEAGATVLGGTDLEEFPKTIPKIRSYTDNYTERSLLYGEGLENIGIHGDGTIDGQGAAFEGPYKARPYMIRLIGCKDVSVTGVTIRDSPMWVQHYLACDDVTIHGITVHSRVNKNNDGIDIDCCHRVTISDCNISSDDDAIVLKSTSDRPTRNVAITNCVLSSRCNAFKLGTESNGGFQDIVLSNCTMYDTRLSGIAIETVDGGVLDGVTVSNVTMRDVESVIFIRLGNRARPFIAGGTKPGAGVLRNVQIANVQATGAGTIGCPISGIPEHAIENVSIENVYIRFKGGVKQADAPAEVPEKEADYPEHRMFGTLPAYGFFCRHVRNIRFRNVHTEYADSDERPAVACEDVRDLDIDGSCFSASVPVIRLRQVNGALIHGCRVADRVSAFVAMDGRDVDGVSLIGNDLSLAVHAVTGGRAFAEANRLKL